MFVVEVDEVLGDLAALGRICAEKGGEGEAANGEVELPGEVEAVVHAYVHALCCFGRMSVRGLRIMS